MELVELPTRAAAHDALVLPLRAKIRTSRTKRGLILASTQVNGRRSLVLERRVRACMSHGILSVVLMV
jgi:hypothetical protein